MSIKNTQGRITGTIPEFLYTDNRVIFIESIIAVLVVWALVAHGLDMTETIASPLIIAESTYALLMSGDWIVHFTATIRRVIYGFILTTSIGTALGIAMGMSDFWEYALQDYITIGLAMPSLFAAIFAAMWFGISDITPMVAGTVIAFPFLAQNVYEGVHDIDNRLLMMSSSFDVSRKRVIKRVVFQGVLPEWFAGARYSFAICWKITTLAELVAASNGIGYMIELNLNALSLSGVLTWTALFTITILIVEYGVLQQIEKRLFDWRQESGMSMMGAA
jgi:ABC-type nitrate/sulfonate/bicarbonate transport system permease component